MKIAVFADVHANLSALQAVVNDIKSWSPDCVFVAGDIVNRGPKPEECLQLINEYVKLYGWSLLYGNHEEYVLQHAKPDAPRSGPEFDVHLASYWTYKKIIDYIHMLQALPRTIQITDPQGEEVRITHASMGGIRDGIYPGMSDDKLRRKIGDHAALFCVGHTHIPLVRRVDDTLVVNVGSAGLPFDGDINVSYARLTYLNGIWDAQIIRLSYDINHAERDFFESGYLDEAGPLSRLVLLELRHARSQLYQWAAQYQELALAGDITMEQSVEEYIRYHT